MVNYFPKKFYHRCHYNVPNRSLLCPPFRCDVGIILSKTHALHLYFYKQPVNEQVALGWKIAKQFSGFNLISLSNNNKYKLEKSGVFPFVINVK